MTTGLLASSCARELVDILPFFGLLLYRYDKSMISSVFDGLMVPLLERIFYLFNQPVGGTDDVLQQQELRRAYLAFLCVVFNKEFDELFLSAGIFFSIQPQPTSINLKAC